MVLVVTEFSFCTNRCAGGALFSLLIWQVIGGGVDSSMESLYLTTPNTPCRSPWLVLIQGIIQLVDLKLLFKLSIPLKEGTSLGFSCKQSASPSVFGPRPCLCHGTEWIKSKKNEWINQSIIEAYVFQYWWDWITDDEHQMLRLSEKAINAKTRTNQNLLNNNINTSTGVWHMPICCNRDKDWSWRILPYNKSSLLLIITPENASKQPNRTY